LTDDLYLPRADDELADASLDETRNLLQIIDFGAEKSLLIRLIYFGWGLLCFQRMKINSHFSPSNINKTALLLYGLAEIRLILATQYRPKVVLLWILCVGY